MPRRADTKFALDLFERIPEAQWKNFAKDDSPVRLILVTQLKAMLDAKDYEGATALVKRIKDANLACATPAFLYMTIRQAANMRSAGRYVEALNLLDQFVKPYSMALARERMGAVLTVARVELIKLDDFERAIKLNEEWGKRVFNDQADKIRTELLKQWGESLMKRERYAEARGKLETYYRMTAPPAIRDNLTTEDLHTTGTLLDVCEYRIRFSALKKGEDAAAFELGEWAGARGLLTESIQAFRRSAQNSALEKTAMEQIDILRAQIAMQYFQKCAELLEKNNPREAMRLLEEFPKEAAQDDQELETKRTRLRKTCVAQLQRQEGLPDFQAQTLLQGTRARILKGERDGVETALEIIRRDYQNTPHAEAAEQLKEAFLRRVAVETLENARETCAELLVPNIVACREAQNILEGLGEKIKTGNK